MIRVIPAALVLSVLASAQEIRLTQIASGISNPTDIQSANDGSGRLFFVQQNGLIRVMRNGASDTLRFLDITAKTRPGDERGVLGLAFPPGFAQSGRFYVDYTDINGDTVIAMYRVTSDPDVADPASETVLLNIRQPFANHNGGQIRFGPDGYLYIAMGDGGGGGDPQGNAQNRNVLLGKILRVDVESDPGHVRIPPDNPFAGQAGARGEIWALGLRNPWRFSFDRATNDLWIADVGQNTYEEVNFQPASSHGGENYGWNIMEGAHCYPPSVSTCNMTGLVLPVAEYTQAEGGCSVTGGFVYRGAASPGLRGTYLYGDYCSGRIWGVTRLGTGWASRVLLNSGFSITTFGEDESGEIYVANADNGTIHRVEGGAAPRVLPGAVVNGASFAAGLAPGSLATVFAAGVLDQPGVVGASAIPLPASLAGVSVSAGGIATPIHVIANRNGQEQVNFQVPFELRGRSSASVTVTRDGQSSAAVDVPVIDIQPGVYSGVAVHNADYSLVTADNPLAPGEYAFVYAAGLGPVTNQPPTGAAAPSSPPAQTTTSVQVTIAGIPCPVTFAGLAPGFVGVFQVNFQVPENLPGGSQDLVLTAGTVSSPPVKVAIR